MISSTQMVKITQMNTGDSISANIYLMYILLLAGKFVRYCCDSWKTTN